jgi:putative hydrolase of the HAD superfamily
VTSGLRQKISSLTMARCHRVNGNVLAQYTSRRYMANWPKVRPKRVRMITMDVTGTIVSFLGTLEQHYLGAAEKCGVQNVDASKITDAFHKAYKETSTKYPCFGGSDITAKQWWRECVCRSFCLAGSDMDEATEDMVFQRIYSTFGSNAAYQIFQDAHPFLDWARRHGLVCGVLSNADERYGDSILPMLGLTHDELKFQCYSKDLNLEKPDARVFMAAIKKGQPFLPHDDICKPSEVLHIGNDFQKDFEGARRVGIHSVLLDRYGEHELASEWRRRGAPVFTDLLDVVEFLGRSNCKLG